MAVTFPTILERELMGMCKHSVFQLRQQLRQYVNEVHDQFKMADTNQLIINAMMEVSSNANEFVSSSHTIFLSLCYGAEHYPLCSRPESEVLADHNSEANAHIGDNVAECAVPMVWLILFLKNHNKLSDV